MTLFTAKRKDGRAEWRVVYDLVINLKPGDNLAFETLSKTLGTTNRHRIYAAVGAAKHHIWAKAQRSLASVKGKGYRVLLPTEHEIQATDYQNQGRRRLGCAVAVMKATDLSTMNAAQRNWNLQVLAGMTLMARAIDAHATKLAQHDDLIRQLQERVHNLEET